MDINLVKKCLLISIIAALLVYKGQCRWSNHQIACTHKYPNKLDPIYNAALDEIIEISVDVNYKTEIDTFYVNFHNSERSGCNFSVKYKSSLSKDFYGVALGNGKIVISSRDEHRPKHIYMVVIDPLNCQHKKLPKAENSSFSHKSILPYQNSFDVVYLNSETFTFWRARYSENGTEESPMTLAFPSNYSSYPWILPKKYDPTLGYYNVLAKPDESEHEHKLSILKLDSNFTVVKKYEIPHHIRFEEKVSYSADLEGLIVCRGRSSDVKLKCFFFDSDLKLLNETTLTFEQNLYDVKVEKLSGNNMLVYYMHLTRMDYRISGYSNTLYGIQLANENGKIGKMLEITEPLDFKELNAYNTRNGSHCIAYGEQLNCKTKTLCAGMTKNV